MSSPILVKARLGPAGAAFLLFAMLVAACSSGTGASPSSSSNRPSPSPSSPANASPPPLAGSNLDPGTYSIAVESLEATMTVPAGWANLNDLGVAKGDGQTFVVVIFWPFAGDFNEVYSDPCHWKFSIIEPPVGPTVDDLANALAAQEMRGDPIPTSVTVGGYEGEYLEMSVPTDIDFADCDEGYFYSWAGRYHQGPGQIDEVYILDVEGERQVLIAHHMPGASAADLAEQQAIVASIDIQP